MRRYLYIAYYFLMPLSLLLMPLWGKITVLLIVLRNPKFLINKSNIYLKLAFVPIVIYSLLVSVVYNSAFPADILTVFHLLIFLYGAGIGDRQYIRMLDGMMKVFYFIFFFMILMAILQILGIDPSPLVMLTRYSEIVGLIQDKYSVESVIISMSERPSFGNPSSMNLLLFCIFCILVNSNRFAKYFLFVFWAMGLAASYISSSRSFMASYFMMALIFLPHKYHKLVAPVLFISAIMLSFLSIIFVFYDGIYSNINYNELKAGDALRFDIRSLTFKHFENFGIFIGSGYGALKEHIEFNLGFRTTPESAYLSTIGSYGIIGSVYILAIIVCIVLINFKKNDVVLGAQIIIWSLLSIVQPLFEYTIFMLYLGLYLSQLRARKSALQNP